MLDGSGRLRPVPGSTPASFRILIISLGRTDGVLAIVFVGSLGFVDVGAGAAEEAGPATGAVPCDGAADVNENEESAVVAAWSGEVLPAAGGVTAVALTRDLPGREAAPPSGCEAGIEANAGFDAKKTIVEKRAPVSGIVVLDVRGN